MNSRLLQLLVEILLTPVILLGITGFFLWDALVLAGRWLQRRIQNLIAFLNSPGEP